MWWLEVTQWGLSTGAWSAQVMAVGGLQAIGTFLYFNLQCNNQSIVCIWMFNFCVQGLNIYF